MKKARVFVVRLGYSRLQGFPTKNAMALCKGEELKQQSFYDVAWCLKQLCAARRLQQHGMRNTC